MGKTRRCLLDLGLAACCVGLGLLLPRAFSWVENGTEVLLLLQLPVLLCGLLCGPGYGTSCGFLIYLFTFWGFGVPVGASDLWEMALYGFLAGLLTNLLNRAPALLNVVGSLVGTMVLGRVCCGLMELYSQGWGYTWGQWVHESFVVPLPGIVLQLAVIPLVTLALRRCGVAAKP